MAAIAPKWTGRRRAVFTAKEVQEAVREALSSAGSFAAVLQAESLEGLAGRFAAIAAHLRDGKLRARRRAYS